MEIHFHIHIIRTNYKNKKRYKSPMIHSKKPKMISQQDWLLRELLEFYKNRDYLEIVKKIVNREFIIEKSKKVSIRIVNWFVTNYAKQYFTVYESSEKERFFVWTRFRSAEDGYSKEMFDPYSRKDRIIIPYDETTKLITTIGQLNFFKWAILNKVIDYIILHYDDITNDMTNRLTVKNKPVIEENTNIKENNINGKTRKKREELSVSACRSIRKEFVPIKITF
jgi:hypothetical protein